MRWTDEDCKRQCIDFLPFVAKSNVGLNALAEREVKKLRITLASTPGSQRGRLSDLAQLSDVLKFNVELESNP